MTVTFKAWDAFLWNEVHEVLVWRGSSIYKTKTTGKFIHRDNVPKLDKNRFTVSPVSTSLTKDKDNVTVEVFEV